MNDATNQGQSGNGMNKPLGAPLGENDIHAFGRPASADVGPAPTQPSRRRWWIWVLVGALGFALVLALSLLLVAVTGVAALADYAQHGGSVLINGRPWDGSDMHAWGWDGWDGWDLGSGLATVVTLVVVSVLLALVPLCLVLALLAVAAALGGALLAVLVCVAVAVALVLAPLWLTLMLLVWGWRVLRRPSNRATVAAGPRPEHSLG